MGQSGKVNPRLLQFLAAGGIVLLATVMSPADDERKEDALDSLFMQETGISGRELQDLKRRDSEQDRIRGTHEERRQERANVHCIGRPASYDDKSPTPTPSETPSEQESFDRLRKVLTGEVTNLSRPKRMSPEEFNAIRTAIVNSDLSYEQKMKAVGRLNDRYDAGLSAEEKARRLREAEANSQAMTSERLRAGPPYPEPWQDTNPTRAREEALRRVAGTVKERGPYYYQQQRKQLTEAQKKKLEDQRKSLWGY